MCNPCNIASAGPSPSKKPSIPDYHSQGVEVFCFFLWPPVNVPLLETFLEDRVVCQVSLQPLFPGNRPSSIHLTITRAMLMHYNSVLGHNWLFRGGICLERSHQRLPKEFWIQNQGCQICLSLGTAEVTTSQALKLLAAQPHVSLCGGRKSGYKAMKECHVREGDAERSSRIQVLGSGASSGSLKHPHPNQLLPCLS